MILKLTQCLSVQKGIFKCLVGKVISCQNTTEQQTTEQKTIIQNSVAKIDKPHRF
nr:MAG TPA: hypothetical protein [Caudoviricetes sp.]